MRLAMAACAAILAVALAGSSYGRAFEVKQLDPKNPNVWGTDEFQVTVSPEGFLRYIKLKGKEIIWQAAAVYTSPVPPDGKAGLRRVQGEGFGARGLSVKPPTVRMREEEGKRIFEYEFLLSAPEIGSGRPLCKMLETVTIAPTGEIDAAYDFEWLETLRWDHIMHLVIFSEPTCRDRDFVVRVKDKFFTGKLDKGSYETRQIRGEAFDQLTIRTEFGPVHYVWTAPTSASLMWSGGIQMQFAPPVCPHGGVIFKGQKDRMAFRILLPVSQQ